MGRVRRQFSNQFKFTVALEAVKGLKTVNQIAGEYSVHPNQVSTWKKQLLAEGPAVFGNGPDKAGQEQAMRETVPALAAGLDDYFELYNYERPHQNLGYRTPADVHFAVAMPAL